jgi:3-deoxy-manno-octulosonate cytidylyltransferase (CMP-KDO synthetase)
LRKTEICDELPKSWQKMTQKSSLFRHGSQASRLPGKPLAEIGGKAMIQHVWERAMAADLAPVYVATDDRAIADVIISAGGKAVMTRTDHPSGSDRVFEAIETIDPDRRFTQILNLQGDLPDLSPEIPHLLAATLDRGETDLATLVTPASAEEAARPQVVKAVVSWQDADFGTALYFSRAAIPYRHNSPSFIILAFMAGAAMRLPVLLPCHHRH